MTCDTCPQYPSLLPGIYQHVSLWHLTHLRIPVQNVVDFFLLLSAARSCGRQEKFAKRSYMVLFTLMCQMDTRIQISSKLTRWVGSTSKNLSTGNALKYRLVGASNNWCTGSWRVTCPLFVKVNEPNYSQSNPLCFLISIRTHILPCESLLMNKWQHMRYSFWKRIMQRCTISYLHIVVIIVALRISCSVVSWT